MGWFLIAFISMLLFSIVFTLYKKIADLGIRSELLFFYYFIISTIVLLFYLFFNTISFHISKTGFLLILIAALLGITGNALIVYSMKIAPNPGYSLAVLGFNTVFVALASVFIFRSELTIMKSIGIFLSVIGLIFLWL